MSNQFRTMGRRIMRQHKILPSKRGRHGIPFRKWVQIVIQMMEAKAAQAAAAVRSKPKTVAEQLKEADNV